MPAARTCRVLAAALATGAALLLAAPAAQAAPAYGKYVALGDSAAAVGTVDRLKPGSSPGCLRAADNYPSVLARTLGVANFTDVSCAGAQTQHMTVPQTPRVGPPNPAQFEALTADTDLVTITIGANDVGATNINTLTAEQLDTVRGNVGAVLDGIHARAPHATVVVTTYLRYLPVGGGCYGLTDQGGMQRVTDTLRAVAATHDARFADNFALTGHGMCEPPGANWVEGPIPFTPSVPLHANATGQAHIASVVAATLAD
ncbi:SGNH/GDSL hydrolase family protein [Nocardia mexicana]|uniref:GDSL-like lipase/acylhydrolase family protein n=1 Tax=Nocardia mexicana TaxID=279262 RepID=A0A370GH18_9NOCA|nr:SGNH/GDSL hydrolase family protein [Nocardia mexicana]RDI42640.1 GDSL-like lipase/acylhydrolase family protein [Nocardia mexicana]